MKKIIALATVFLLAAGMSAAADRHGPMRTGLFEVHPGDEAPDGEQVSAHAVQEGSDVIYGKYAGTSSAAEQDEKDYTTHNVVADTATDNHGDTVSKIATEEGKDVNIIKEKKKLAGDNHGDKVSTWATGDGDAGAWDR